MGELLARALEYAARGWSIIPVRRGTKQPAVRQWKRWQAKRPDGKRLRHWFANGRYDALAVVLGPVSGDLACRDFDQADAYARWAEQYRDLAETLPTGRTARGYHVYFRRGEVSLQQLPDGELRGAGCTCLLPPSKHPDGDCYRWEREPGDGPLPEIDPASAGLMPQGVQQKRTDDNRGRTEVDRRTPRAIRSVAGCSEDEIENAIAATLPTAEGTRHQQVFKLARALRGIPGLASADPNDLKPIVRRWHSLALPIITTKPFEETWIDFLKAWPRVHTPLRFNLMEDVMTAAKACCADNVPYETPGLRLLVRFCQELQRQVGDQPFFLACRTAGRLLEIDPTTASRWLFLLEHDGWIRMVQKGGTVVAPRRATRYRFVGPP